MAQESESEMGKLKNILKKNLRWVATGAVLALIMGGAFLGYRAYVQADAEFLFSISMQTDFSTVSKTDARAKIEPQLGTLPDDFASRFNPSKYSWTVKDDNNQPVFTIRDSQATPGIAVLSEVGAGTSYLTATYKDAYYTDADGNIKEPASVGSNTEGLTYHELVADSQNIFTVKVPLRMVGYVGSDIMTAANNTFIVSANVFDIRYNAYTNQDQIDSTYHNDYHTVSFTYNPSVLAQSASTFTSGAGVTSFSTIGGGSSGIWATVDGTQYKLSEKVYVGVKNTSKGDAGITVEQGSYVSLSEGYTNILTGNFGYEDLDGNKNVYFWTLQDRQKSVDSSLTLVDVVDVSDSGVITGKYAGKTTVYASCKPMNESYNTDGSLKTEYASGIEVEVPYGLKFSENILVSIGDNIPLYTTAFDSNVTYSYEYNNEGAVNQIGTGLYEAVKEGTAIIKVVIERVENGVTVKTETVYAKIQVIDKLMLSKSEASINVGAKTQISAIPTSTDTTKVSNVTWKSADESIATVEWDNSSFESALDVTITGISKGKTKIYAYQTVNGVVKVASMDLTVTIPVDGITLSEPQNGKSHLTMYLGQTLTIYADLQYSDNNVPDNTELIWEASGSAQAQSLISLNPVITTGVHQSCDVTAQGLGNTTLTVYSKDNSQIVNLDIFITERPTSIELSDTNVVVAMSQKQYQLTGYVHSATDGCEQSIIWTSLNTDVVTVDRNTGLVTLVAPGSTEICATSEVDPSITAYCHIEVAQDVYGIKLDKTQLTFNVGDTYRLTATVNPDNAYDKTMVWTSSNPSVVSVENSTSYENLLTAVGSGSATIFAETNDGGFMAYCNVRVLQPVTGITLSNSEMTVRKGTEFYLNASVIPDTADDKTIVWSTSDSAVATVSSDGKVSTIGVGQCIITATNPASKVAASCTVVVLEPLTGLSLNTYYQNMVKGTKFVLLPIVEPSTASNKKVTFWSSDNDIATVDEKGVITAVKGGICEIVVTTEEGSFSQKCVIAVKEYVTSITLSDEKRYLNHGSSYTLSAKVEPESASDKGIIWTSSNESVLTVNQYGTMTGVGYGTAVVTATAADGSGVSASCIVQVIRPVTDIKLSKSKITLYVGDVFHLVATVEPADASVKKLEWTSSDPTVAKVYDDGDVEAVGVGRCKVYATSTDGNNVVAECTIIVKQIVSATSVTINSHEILMLTGKVRTLTARLFPINSTETVKWVSSDTSVVVVDSNGQITTVGPGSCQVTAYTTYGTIQDTCMVYSMAISKSSTTLEQYDTFNLYVDGAPSTAAVSWRSSNPRIATVTQRGIVTARMPGECTITATVDGKTVTCNVIVRSIDPGKFINKTNEKP